MGIKILAGDGLKTGKSDRTSIMLGQLFLKKEKGWFAAHEYKLTQIKEIQTIDEENFRTFGSTAGWGLVGIALAGPFGAVLGGYFGGKKNIVVAAVEMDDGLRFLAEFSQGSFRKLTKHYRYAENLKNAGMGN